MSQGNKSQIFLKNIPAVIGAAFITLLVIASLLAYLFIPDNSKQANRQIIELKLKPPGFKMALLQIPLENTAKQTVFNRLFFGHHQNARYIPILNHQIQGDQLLVESYVGRENEGLSRTFPLSIWDSSPEKYIKTEKFLLGTDALGRDYFSRLIVGARISILVGFMSVLISLLIGTSIGMIAGYFRGWADKMLMYGMSVFWSIPTIFFALSLILVFGGGIWQVFLAIGLTMWIEVARLTRGQVLSLREMEYIKATKVLGYSTPKILIRHILPNLTGPLIVLAASNFAAAILLESGLSFIGLGVSPPTPSWGIMLAEHKEYILGGKPWLAIAPGLAISFLVLSFFLIGAGLRDVFDSRTIN